MWNSVTVRLKETLNPTIDPIEPRIRVDVGNRLSRITHNVDAATARVVLEAQTESVRILREASTALDTKANVIIVASGALLTAFVTISPAEKSHFPHWTLVTALILLAGAFVFGIAAIFVVGFSLPTPAVYNRYSTLADSRNEGKICSELTEAWYRYGLRERRSNAKKANRVVLGFGFVALALLVLVIGAATAVLGPESAAIPPQPVPPSSHAAKVL
jgi:hypothetical protein